MNFNDYLILLLPIIVGLVQAIKQTELPNKYLPFVSIILAEIICFIFVKNLDSGQVVILGLEIGLGAVGLYSGVASFIKPPTSPAEKYGLKRQKFDKRDFHFSALEGNAIPLSIDMRSLMPPIYDQLQLGSCTANSSTAYDVFLNNNQIELSRLFEYYETREIEGTVGEDSGATNRDAVKSINQNGICEESLMPYDITKFTIPPTTEAIINAKKYTISSYTALDNLEHIKQALSISKPVIIGMKVYSSFESSKTAATGQMSMPCFLEPYLGGHSVLVVGYDDTKNNLIVRNSWGPNWGDKGHFYMPYKYLNKYTFDYWIMNKAPAAPGPAEQPTITQK